MNHRSTAKAILLVTILVGLQIGLQAQTPETSVSSWASVPLPSNSVLLELADVGNSDAYDAVVASQVEDSSFATVRGISGFSGGRFWSNTSTSTSQAGDASPAYPNGFGPLSLHILNNDGNCEIVYGEQTEQGTLRKVICLEGADPVDIEKIRCGGAVRWLILTQSSPYIFSLNYNLQGISLLNWGLSNLETKTSGFNSPLPEKRPALLEFPSGATDIESADFNNDGALDLALVSGSERRVYVIEGNGQCGFRTLAASQENSVSDLHRTQFYQFDRGRTPSSLVVKDFNGDTRPDLGVGLSGAIGGYAAVFLNRGDGIIPAMQTEERESVEDGPQEVDATAAEQALLLTSGDLNNDNRADLIAVGNQGKDEPGGIVTALGEGDGTFGHQKSIGNVENPSPPQIHDFNQDSIPDLVVATNSGVEIWLGDGRGGFHTAQVLPVDQPLLSLTSRDLDDDGDPDIVTSDTSTEQMHVFVNQHPVADEGQLFVKERSRLGKRGGLQSLALGNLDGDAQNPSDIALTTIQPTTSEVQMIRGGGANHGYVPGANEDPDGSFQVLQSAGNSAFLSNDGVGARLLTLAVGNLDNDESDELVVADEETGDVHRCTFDSSRGGSISCEVIVESLPRPRAAAVGDFAGFNEQGEPVGDGHPDLAVATWEDGRVWLFRGDGQGNFTSCSPKAYQVGSQPSAIEIADFNDDESQDLAIANSGSNNIMVLFNSGSQEGTFLTPAVQVDVGVRPLSLTSADFDADDDQDIAVANFGSDSVSVLLNNGDGTFPTVKNVASDDSLKGPISITAGSKSETSLNHLVNEQTDQLPDLAVANFMSSDVSILIGGKEDGSFSFTVHGMEDIVSSQGNEIRNIMGYPCIVCQTQDGSSWANLPNGPVAIATRSSISANEDTALQLVVALEFPSNRLSEHPELPSETKSALEASGRNKPNNPWESIYIIGTESKLSDNNNNGPELACQHPDSLLIRDFNDDENGDILGTCLVSNGENKAKKSGVFQLEGTFDGEFLHPPQIHRFDNDQGPSALLADRFDSDQQLDLAVAHAGTNNVSLLFGNGSGQFEFSDDGSHAIEGVGRTPVALASADFDQDNDLDLAVACQTSNHVRIFCQGAEDNYRQCATLRVDPTISPTAIAAADLNRDQAPDIVVAGLNGDGESGALWRYLNDGQGTFADGGESVAVGRSPQAVATGRFDGDPHVDVAVASLRSSPQGKNLTLLFGDGQGAFPRRRNVPLAGNLVDIATVNLNDDDAIDLAVVQQGPDRVTALLNDAQARGHYDMRQTLTVGESPTSVAAGAVNNDGHGDLVVANRQSNDLTLFLGAGDGTFQRSTLPLREPNSN